MVALIQAFLTLPVLYWVGPLGVIFAALWFLEARRAKPPASARVLSPEPAGDIPSGRPWRGADAHSLDRIEEAQLRAQPLTAIVRAVFFGSLLLNLLVIALLLVNPGAMIEAIGLLLIMTLVGAAAFFVSLRALQRLNGTALKAMAALITLCLVVVALSFALSLGLSRDMRGIEIRLIATLLALWLLWSIARGWWALARLDEDGRALLRTIDGPLLSRPSIKDYFGIPHTTAYLTANRRRVVLSFLASSLMLSLFVSTLIGLLGFGPMDRSVGTPYFVLMLSPLFLLMFAAAASFFQKLARANAWIGLEQMTATDRRPPILFLRAFKDDQIALPAPRLGLLGRLLSLGASANSLDALLVEETASYGPLVALGNPSDAFPPYGAARGYFEHKNWQQAVADLADRASFIILCLELTESVDWEIEHVLDARHLDKVVFVVPPGGNGPGRNAALVRRLIAKLRARQPELASEDTHQSGDTIAITSNASGGFALLRSRYGSRLSYQLALRDLMRRKRHAALPTSEEAPSVPAMAGKPRGFGLAPLLDARPPLLSALEIGGALAAFTFIADYLGSWRDYRFATHPATYVVYGLVTALALYGIVRLVGRVSHASAALAGILGSVSSLVLLQFPDSFVPEPLMQSDNFSVAHFAVAALVEVLFAVVLVPRLRRLSLLPGALFVGAICAIAAIEGEAVVRIPSFADLDTVWWLAWGAAQDLLLFVLLAATLGLPLLPRRRA